MICSVADCNNPSKYKGLCGMHYKRQWRHGDVNKTTTPRKLESIKCSVIDCENLISHSCGLCKKHEQRFRRYGRLENILGNKGDGHINSQGYVVLTIDGKRVYEHRLLAEKALGKQLPEGAVVHHTKAPWDNHGPFKLVICPDQDYHLLLHRRAKELGYEDN